MLQAQMAYFGYRLTDPAVWSAERGYCSGNQNMTVTWEMSRGLMACTIPEHPMAKTWYRKAACLEEQLLTHMVGPGGEWPESMGGHGRTSIDMVLAFAIAATNAGFHDYVNDPRVKRMILYWAKVLMPRDPRPRGIHADAIPDRRAFPPWAAIASDIPAAPAGAGPGDPHQRPRPFGPTPVGLAGGRSLLHVESPRPLRLRLLRQAPAGTTARLDFRGTAVGSAHVAMGWGPRTNTR